MESDSGNSAICIGKFDVMIVRLCHGNPLRESTVTALDGFGRGYTGGQIRQPLTHRQPGSEYGVASFLEGSRNHKRIGKVLGRRGSDSELTGSISHSKSSLIIEPERGYRLNTVKLESTLLSAFEACRVKEFVWVAWFDWTVIV